MLRKKISHTTNGRPWHGGPAETQPAWVCATSILWDFGYHTYSLWAIVLSQKSGDNTILSSEGCSVDQMGVMQVKDLPQCLAYGKSYFIITTTNKNTTFQEGAKSNKCGSLFQPHSKIFKNRCMIHSVKEMERRGDREGEVRGKGTKRRTSPFIPRLKAIYPHFTTGDRQTK